MGDKITVTYDDMDGWQPKNSDEVYDMSEAVRFFKEKIERVAERYCKAIGKTAYFDIDECEIDIGHNTIHLRWTEHDRCGGWDTETLDIPVQFLWEDDWEKGLEEQRKQKEEEERKKKEAQKKRDKEALEKRQYEQYQALKRKFEGGEK